LILGVISSRNSGKLMRPFYLSLLNLRINISKSIRPISFLLCESKNCIISTTVRYPFWFTSIWSKTILKSKPALLTVILVSSHLTSVFSYRNKSFLTRSPESPKSGVFFLVSNSCLNFSSMGKNILANSQNDNLPSPSASYLSISSFASCLVQAQPISLRPCSSMSALILFIGWSVNNEKAAWRLKSFLRTTCCLSFSTSRSCLMIC